MKKAHIIIGLGFGDEGKGIATDFLAKHHPKAIVIRFSGGQQAAHTVIIDDKKHVHSSFSSGALRGLPSYYSEHCTIHPTFLYNERKELIAKGGNTTIHIHPLAKISTPFDVWKNKNDATNLKNGSCGMGVGATMKRNESPYKLFAVDLIAPTAVLIEKLKSIASYYGYAKDEKLQQELATFLDVIAEIDWNITNYSHLESYKTLLFEGSQGILLDMDHGIFPNVTYAHTTSKNAHQICNQLQIKDRTTHYITRSYQTRHGYGWMSNESELNLQNNEEETCVYNEFQKELRIGKLDYELLNYALKIDSAYSQSSKHNLIVTCLDQLEFNLETEKLNTKFHTIYGSFSPDSKDFKKLQ